MRRAAVGLVMAGALAMPAWAAAQGSAPPVPRTPLVDYLGGEIAAAEALGDILASGGPDDAAAGAGAVADAYESFLLGVVPEPCYSALYVNDWQVATIVRLLSEVPAGQRQGMVDLLVGRLDAVDLDAIDCGADAAASAAPGPVATTSPPTRLATPAPTKRPSYRKLGRRAWQRIVRSPDDHVGEAVQLWACIWQFDSRTGKGSFLASASNAREEYWYTDGEDAMFAGPESRLDPVVEGDVVWMTAVVEGSYDYDTAAGGTNSVPAFEVRGIRRKGSCD